MIVTAKTGLTAGPSGLPTLTGVAPKLSTVGLDTGLPPSLSMSDLVSWLTTRVRTTDEGIRADMAAMGSLKDRQKALSSLASELRSLKIGADGEGKVALDDKAIAALEGLRGTLGPDGDKALDALLGKVDRPASALVACSKDDPGAIASTITDVFTGAVITTYGKLVTPPPQVSTATLDETVKALGDAQQALSGESEIGMIRLQSALSARGQLLSLVSNILSSVNDTAKGIVAKVGS